MKRRIIVFFALFLILCFIFLCIKKKQQNIKFQENNNNYYLSPQEKTLLQEGDIILRHGFGLISDAITKFSNDTYPISHCGVIVFDNDSSIAVVHTVSNSLVEIDGMQKDNLDKFVKDSHLGSIIVVRYRYKDSISNKKIAQQTKLYLQKEIPFDDKFDFQDSSEFFCTEMIWRIFYKALNVNIFNTSNKKTYNAMQFSPFLDTTNFQIIINHFDTLVYGD